MKTEPKLGTFGRVHEVFDVLVGFPAKFVQRTLCGLDYYDAGNYLSAKRTPCPACAAVVAGRVE